MYPGSGCFFFKLIREYTPSTVRVSENLVLASDSSNQQTLVLKEISVESVQMIFKLAISNIW